MTLQPYPISKLIKVAAVNHLKSKPIQKLSSRFRDVIHRETTHMLLEDATDCNLVVFALAAVARKGGECISCMPRIASNGLGARKCDKPV